MRKVGAKAEFNSQRDKELVDAFKKQLHLLGTMPQNKLFERASKMPASRFWVSEGRAAIVVSHLLKGGEINSMNPKKQEMYKEILKRVKAILREHPGVAVGDAVFKVVNSNAPEFYLTPLSARALIYKARA